MADRKVVYSVIFAFIAIVFVILQHRMPSVPASYRIGIIADTQYADTEDGTTFDKTMVRRYRQSLRILQSAVEYFNEHTVVYGVQLGDVLDGRTKRLQMAERCLQDILSVTSISKHPWSYCVGNHDLDAIDREMFIKHLVPQNRLNSTSGDVRVQRLYYDVSPVEGFRFLFIDGYEMSTLSPISSEHLEQSNTLLSQKNKNLVRNDGDWFVDLEPEDMKYVPYNGAVSQEQLQWIRDTLHYARQHSERCIIFSHMPIYPESCRPSGLMWNSEEILSLIHSDEFSGVVVALIAGHDHDGGYAVDAKGIHHLIPPAPLECDEGQVAYGFLTLYPATEGKNYMDFDWVGKLPIVRPEQWPTRLNFR